MPTIDWNSVVSDAAAGPQPVPDGPYDVVVSSAEGKIAQTGAPMVTVLFSVLNGPYQSQTIYNNFVLSMGKPAALGYFLEHMAALGVPKESVMALPQDAEQAMDQLAMMINGKQATITVGHREYQGRTVNQVESVKPMAGQAQVPGQQAFGADTTAPVGIPAQPDTGVPPPPTVPPF